VSSNAGNGCRLERVNVTGLRSKVGVVAERSIYAGTRLLRHFEAEAAGGNEKRHHACGIARFLPGACGTNSAKTLRATAGADRFLSSCSWRRSFFCWRCGLATTVQP
jgi:hypothetical protein